MQQNPLRNANITARAAHYRLHLSGPVCCRKAHLSVSDVVGLESSALEYFGLKKKTTYSPHLVRRKTKTVMGKTRKGKFHTMSAILGRERLHSCDIKTGKGRTFLKHSGCLHLNNKEIAGKERYG